jgi:hypothetical protein
MQDHRKEAEKFFASPATEADLKRVEAFVGMPIAEFGKLSPEEQFRALGRAMQADGFTRVISNAQRN